jgi:hypothetical protein
MDVKALCGAEIANAQAVLEFELNSGCFAAKHTLILCRVCTVLALTPVDHRTYVYGILPAEIADRMNAGEED